MGSIGAVFLRVAVLAAVFGFTVSSFVSNNALQGRESTSRSLLQAKKECPVSFEGANYTIITSQCKGPMYPPALCCGALKDFACPYASYINDATSTCSTIMFSYINLYGKYPPGLFANTCREGNNGLTCPEDGEQVQPGHPSSAHLNTAFAAPFLVAAGIALSISMFLSS